MMSLKVCCLLSVLVYLQVSNGCQIRWVRESDGKLPEHPVEGGFDPSDNVPTYVGRGRRRGSLNPGEVVPRDGVVYITQRKKQHAIRNYEVLTNPNKCNLNWKASCCGESVPKNAIHGGHEADGEDTYVARVMINGSYVPGKVVPSYTAAFVAVGDEHKTYSYEILVNEDVPTIGAQAAVEEQIRKELGNMTFEPTRLRA